MTRLRIKNKEYRIINSYSIKSSNNQVTFNNIKIDFTEGTAEDIPFKYQEIQIVQDNKIIFTGFLDTIKLGALTTKNPYKEMTLTLLSPLKLATKRCISLIGTNNINTAITRILQPLIDDGFVIAEMNVPEGQITTSFVIETVENAMNIVCSKRNLFWHIDANKNIYVNSVEFMFGKPAQKVITEEYEKGLLSLQPTISNIDYANIINFKNVRLIYSNLTEAKEYPIVEIGKSIKNGDYVDFINPVIVDEDTLRKRMIEENISDALIIVSFTLFLSNNKYVQIYIQNDPTEPNYGKYITSGTLSISYNNDGGNEGDIVLQRDPFFKELITGFKYNGNSDVTITKCSSHTALRYTTMRFVYSKEIESLKGIISNSGQIEKTIDYAEKWVSAPQLIDYARSLMLQNSNEINEVIIQYDINPQLQIGDIIEIKRPNFFIDGNFAVKSINYTYHNELHQNWYITAKKSDFISSYIDLFRPDEKQESVNAIDTVILSEFIEEGIAEKFIIGEK